MNFDWTHITDEKIVGLMKDGYALLKNDLSEWSDGNSDQYILVKSPNFRKYRIYSDTKTVAGALYLDYCSVLKMFMSKLEGAYEKINEGYAVVGACTDEYLECMKAWCEEHGLQLSL